MKRILERFVLNTVKGISDKELISLSNDFLKKIVGILLDYRNSCKITAF
jgi:hypothetical protein